MLVDIIVSSRSGFQVVSSSVAVLSFERSGFCHKSRVPYVIDVENVPQNPGLLVVAKVTITS